MMAPNQGINVSTVILSSFLDAFKSSQGALPPHGYPTIHQKAFFLCWCSVVFVWLVRTMTKYILPGRYNLFNAGVPSSPSNASSRILVEQIEEGNIPRQNEKPVAKEIQKKPAEDISFDSFLHAVTVLGLIMYFFYICDYVHMFPKASRTYSRDLFILFGLLLFIVAGGLTCKECNGKLLNRDQTEEWKGWMQVMFVWYHYFKAAEIYNAIRLFIAAYVWMTGFGNFSFFWVRRDYSLYRILKMLFRLNFLVTIVTVVTNNQYMLYYICAMHTFWFFSVYAMMRPYEHLNENRKVMILKMLIYAFVIFVIYDLGAADIVFTPFKFILSYNGSLHEWKFRSGLDHYATLFGMICAYNHPNFERLLDYVERESFTVRQKLLKNGIRFGIGMIFFGAILLWYFNVYTLGKYDYNKLHPYTSIIPILSYLYFRNILPKWRKRYAYMFSWLGKITLETYIAQLHIYMQGNAKHLIVYIHDYPLLNFFMATIIYLVLSYFLFNVTVTLSAFLLPKDMASLAKKVGFVSVWILISYVVVLVTSPQRIIGIIGQLN